MEPVICLQRTQDLKNFDDKYCVECWEALELQKWVNGEEPSYLDREDCFEENCVTEEEFDVLDTKATKVY